MQVELGPGLLDGRIINDEIIFNFEKESQPQYYSENIIQS